MIHFFDDTKVYVIAPAGVVTGGSELLHQFVDLLNRGGKEAYIVYYGAAEHKIADDYKKYNIKLKEEYDDAPHNIIVLFEGNFERALEIKHAQLLLWWLSVDLMYYGSASKLSLKDLFEFSPIFGFKTFLRRIRSLLFKGENQFKNNHTIADLARLDATNAYQAVYIQQYLYRHGFDNIISLSDYINVDFVSETDKTIIKEDIILYNPKKGIKFTKKIINANPDLKFVPIQGLSRDGVVELLKKAKVYIDFGFHPGKDRLPREAALSGCVVITGRGGSAYYFEDVAIPSSNKFDAKNKNINKISRKIRSSINNYEEEKSVMDYYRYRINKEKAIFEQEVAEIMKL